MKNRKRKNRDIDIDCTYLSLDDLIKKIKKLDITESDYDKLAFDIHIEHYSFCGTSTVHLIGKVSPLPEVILVGE